MSRQPRFEYQCKACGAPATKKPLKNQKDWKSLTPADFGGLGSWHCSGGCRGKVPVVRRSVEKVLVQAA